MSVSQIILSLLSYTEYVDIGYYSVVCHFFLHFRVFHSVMFIICGHVPTYIHAGNRLVLQVPGHSPHTYLG